MGVQQRMVQTTNLVGYNLDPRGLDEPPPDIRLPPNVRWICYITLDLGFATDPASSFSAGLLQQLAENQRSTLLAEKHSERSSRESYTLK
jgi:hypothetical protein